MQRHNLTWSLWVHHPHKKVSIFFSFLTKKHTHTHSHIAGCGVWVSYVVSGLGIAEAEREVQDWLFLSHSRDPGLANKLMSAFMTETKLFIV